MLLVVIGGNCQIRPILAEKLLFSNSKILDSDEQHECNTHNEFANKVKPVLWKNPK